MRSHVVFVVRPTLLCTYTPKIAKIYFAASLTNQSSERPVFSRCLNFLVSVPASNVIGRKKKSNLVFVFLHLRY